MSYNKTLVSDKQKAVIKSITDLLDVLSEIDIDNNSGNDAEVVLEDGSIMTLGLTANENGGPLYVEKVSLTSARLNLDIKVKHQDETVIRLVKKQPEKTIITLKKATSDE